MPSSSEGSRYSRARVLCSGLLVFTGLLAWCCPALGQNDSLVNCDALKAGEPQMISVDCGGAPSATFDLKGGLWVAFVQDEHVYVSHSEDKGRHFSSPVMVNTVPEDAEFNGENRPKIVVASAGEILLSWTTKTSSKYTGEIRFSRSVDGGRSFETPRTINDDNLFTGHRFDSLFLTESGNLYLMWIDKRDLEASLARGEEYPGAAIYYAVSKDLGRSFSRNYPVSANSCECCRIAFAPYGKDKAAILWRQIYEGTTRDHAIAVLGPDGQVNDLNRATVDDWQINACPHHGPAMTAAASGGHYHVSWFTAGNLHKGIYYGLSDLNGNTTQIFRVDSTPGAGHPSLARSGDTLLLAWKGFDGHSTPIKLIKSYDEGVTWSAPEVLWSTDMASDYPLLVNDADQVYLSWLSEQYGYVIEAIEP